MLEQVRSLFPFLKKGPEGGKEKKSIEFDLKLADLEWELKDSTSDDEYPKIESSATSQDVLVKIHSGDDGVQSTEIALNGKKISNYVQGKEQEKFRLVSEEVYLKFGTNECYIDGRMIFHFNPDTNFVTVTTSVKKEGEDGLPKGIGIKLYEKMLESMQKLADKNGINYRHIEMFDPELSSGSMKRDDWEDLFLPRLNGYRQDGPNNWIKDYQLEN